MKKRHKGYFKKPTNILEPSVREYIKMKHEYSTDKKFRIGLWVNLYLRESKIKVTN
ncbi:hypothetical protein [Enterococcus phage Bp29]|uniref:Uncharacterized protein n=1 Tax=Enterococcus phage vB_EfaS-DELF1 TaxID=2683673 RepID=A0A5S9MQ25_9CAUD|nr:hypothetical protein [Enterococcus phage Bp29]BBQ04319.1 hypothetical protein [Enterococcus phage vB_EfaS-DELF1]